MKGSGFKMEGIACLAVDMLLQVQIVLWAMVLTSTLLKGD